MTQKKKIEFGELRIGPTAQKHLNDVCQTGWASEGIKVQQFEEQWGKLFNYPCNVAMSSGTDAVMNACMALYHMDDTAQPNDEIIVPALGFMATANAVRAAGFRPVFVDIEKETLNINEELIDQSYTRKTLAIITVHTMGRMCRMDILNDISDDLDVFLIEDACEAHGARYKGEFVGHQSDMACFSYYIAHLICCAEGGMVSTSSTSLYDNLKSTKCHGRSGEYFDHPRFGLNSKMNDLEASLGLEGIQNFWYTFDKRRKNYKTLYRELEKYKDMVWFSEEDKGNINCPHGFSITLKKPGKLSILTQTLDEASIHWKRNFGCIPTQHGAFKYLDYKLGDFPNAEHVGNNGIHLGVHQYLSDDDLHYMVTHISKGLDKCK